MPPFSTTAASAAATGHGAAQLDHRIVTINVGGQIFQTTHQTLSRAGPKSILSTLSSSPSIPFLDRDPALFSSLLSLLRSGRLPTSPSPDLLAEARHYGLSHTLISALSTPTTFRPFSLTRSLLLPLHGRDPVSSLAASPSGAVLAAHGGKVTAFDASLRHRSTTLTLLPAIDSIVSVSDHHAAVGATDFPGVHLINLDNRAVAETLTWDIHPSVTSASSTVQALASSPDLIFTSFESSRRNASAIVAFDVHTLQTVAEIGRKEVYGADLDSAIPATKLKWVPELNLLMAAGSHSGPSGLMGNVRLWDVRSGKAVWWGVNLNPPRGRDSHIRSSLMIAPLPHTQHPQAAHHPSSTLEPTSSSTSYRAPGSLLSALQPLLLDSDMPANLSLQELQPYLVCTIA